MTRSSKVFVATLSLVPALLFAPISVAGEQALQRSLPPFVSR